MTIRPHAESIVLCFISCGRLFNGDHTVNIRYLSEIILELITITKMPTVTWNTKKKKKKMSYKGFPNDAENLGLKFSEIFCINVSNFNIVARDTYNIS